MTNIKKCKFWRDIECNYEQKKGCMVNCKTYNEELKRFSEALKNERI